MADARGAVVLSGSEADDAWRPAAIFSDLEIETARKRRLVFRLPLHPTEGFVTSELKPLGRDLAVPDHGT